MHSAVTSSRHEAHHEVLVAAARSVPAGGPLGLHRGGAVSAGKQPRRRWYVGAIDRDRVEALLLLVKAMPLVAADKTGTNAISSTGSSAMP